MALFIKLCLLWLDEFNVTHFSQVLVDHKPPGRPLAIDCFGGIFVEMPTGQVSYFAPDCLDWENLDLDVPTFQHWLTTERPLLFYQDFLFSGFEDMAEQIKAGFGISTYPFLWSAEYDPKTASRRLVPLMELLTLNAEFLARLI